MYVTLDLLLTTIAQICDGSLGSQSLDPNGMYTASTNNSWQKCHCMASEDRVVKGDAASALPFFPHILLEL